MAEENAEKVILSENLVENSHEIDNFWSTAIVYGMPPFYINGILSYKMYRDMFQSLREA